MTQEAADRDRPLTTGRAVLESPATAITTIWAATTAVAVWAPDLISGSQHEHLPIALATTWLWAGLASAYAAMTPRRSSRAAWTVSVSSLWVLTALVCVFAPQMVTGTDPTQIPLGVLVAPPVAAAVTGLLSLRQATS